MTLTLSLEVRAMLESQLRAELAHDVRTRLTDFVRGQHDMNDRLFADLDADHPGDVARAEQRCEAHVEHEMERQIDGHIDHYLELLADQKAEAALMSE